jgi:heme-binding protein
LRLRLKRILVATGLLLLAIQFAPVSRINPKEDTSQMIYASLPAPTEVKAVFDRSCRNCHSNETVWPWYSYVAPVSWMVARDVHQGRKKMNLSEWGTYSAQRKEDRLEEICEQVTNGEMPDRKYAIFHREARVTPQERNAICQWTDDSRQY